MAQLINGAFDATQYNPAQGSGQFDVGRHKVVVESSKIDATKAGDGGMIIFGLKSIEGPSQGQTMDYRINLYNASAKAVEVAQRQFSALCHVVGIFHVQDTQQLHNIPFMVDVRKQTSDERYNEIGKVLDVNGNEPGKASNQPQQQQGPGAGAFGAGQQQQQQPNQQGGFGQAPNQGGFGQQQQGGFGQQQQGGFGQQQQGSFGQGQQQGGFGQDQQQQQQQQQPQQQGGFGQQQQQQQQPQWSANQGGGQQQAPQWGS